jgi:hypothetical protein
VYLAKSFARKPSQKRNSTPGHGHATSSSNVTACSVHHRWPNRKKRKQKAEESIRPSLRDERGIVGKGCKVLNRRRRRSQQAESIAKDLRYEAKVVVIGEKGDGYVQVGFFVFEFLMFFCVAVSVEQIFSQVGRVECNGRIRQECNGEKKIMTCD